MSYILSQYNQPMVPPSDPASAMNEVFMTQLSGGTPRRRQNASDSGVSGGSLDPFYDECLTFGTQLSAGVNYYFHAKIKRLHSNQTFYIYLVNYEQSSTEENKTQYLKTITVQSGDETEWVDFEILFTPLFNFDTILFQLQRTIEDYREDTRYPVIVYEEFSRINNMIASKIRSSVSLLKVGVQSHPGLMMCLNGQEIHVGRSGTYEVRNGVVLVDFFSIIMAASEDINGNNPLRDPSTGARISLDQYLAYIASLPTVEGKDNTNSQCIFDKSKLRAIDAFTFDYMYKEEE